MIGLNCGGPVLGPADDLADEGDQQLLLGAALEAELAAQVTELAELAAGEAGWPPPTPRF